MSSSNPALDSWLHGAFAAEALTPEASPRRYLRSSAAATRGWLRVLSPTPAPRALTQFLAEHEIPVPRLGAEADGVYLVEDLGDRHLGDAPAPEAYAALLAIQRRYLLLELPASLPNQQLALDATLFRRELALYAEHAVDQPAPAARAAWNQALDALAERAAAGPQALQHRDLHSRNVLLVEGRPVLIDHQDMRRGPLFYDLMSLRTDAYLDLPVAVDELLAAEEQRLGAWAGLAPHEAARQAAWTGWQRVWKALGSFGRLLAEGRSDYRPAAQRAARHAERLAASLAEEFRADPQLAPLFAHRPGVLPAS